jgi:hypothetical protein
VTESSFSNMLQGVGIYFSEEIDEAARYIDGKFGSVLACKVLPGNVSQMPLRSAPTSPVSSSDFPFYIYNKRTVWVVRSARQDLINTLHDECV